MTASPYALRTTRLLNLIVALSYPVGGILLSFYFPGVSDPVWIRAVLTLLHLGLVAGSFRSPKVANELPRITAILFYVATAHALYLVYGHNLSLGLVIYLLIDFSVITSFFATRRALLGYLVFTMIAASFVAFSLRAHPLAPVFVLLLAALCFLSFMLQSGRLAILQALSESESRFRSLFEAAFEGLIIHEGGVILAANQAVSDMVHRQSAELVGQPVTSLISNNLKESFEKYLLSNSGQAFETVGQRSSGATYYLEVLSRPHIFEGRAARVTALRDVTERKRAEELIAQHAHRDPLTELPTRRLFTDRLSVALAGARRRDEGFCIMVLDFDELRAINEKYGHDVGELVLVGAANRMKKTIRDSDTVARLSGDEFVFLLLSVDLVGARIAAEKMVDAFSEPFIVQGETINVAVRLGLSLFPNDGDTGKTLLHRAGVALQVAKKEQRQGSVFVLFEETLAS